MAKRVRLEEPKPTQSYFVQQKEGLEFITSGCELLDCCLGGGYPFGRMSNIIGDKSTAKTALATEAINTLLLDYSDGNARYVETEGAFDQRYAEAMGMQLGRVDFGNKESPVITIEDFYDDFNAFLKNTGKKTAGIYVVDSWDGLSDEEEMKRDIDKGTYAMNKQKKLSEMFRKVFKSGLDNSRTHLMIVSQVRENINASFGEKYRRSGGKALDFYASQFLWLAHLGQIKKTINKIDRVIGIKVKAQVKKNKVGFPFRSCEFEFLFGYGVDDLAANVEWLRSIHRLDAIDLKDSEIKDYYKESLQMDDEQFKDERLRVAEGVRKVWAEVETTFLPERRKYA